MGEPTGFINWKRTTPKRRPIPVRVADWREVYEAFPAVDLKHQAGRCKCVGRNDVGTRIDVVEVDISE